ncbi:MAG: hypothetical protein ACI4C1_08810 [Lachnospiraceae bacterium]
MNTKRLTTIFLTISIFLTILRILTAQFLPIWGIVSASYDDALMVNNAWYLSNLEWLGPYNQNILVKGISFPLCLAFCSITGIKMTTFFILLWIISVLIFLLAIRPLIKNTTVLLIIYCILLFNPEFTNKYVILRVYRNGLSPSQVLMIFGGMFGLFLRYKQGVCKMLPYSLWGSFGFVFFWFTREDSFWIMPFMIVFAITMIVLIIMLKKSWKERCKKMFFIILPFCSLTICSFGISRINAKVYGVPIVNEFSEGAFPRALQSIMSADTGDELPQYVSVTKEKLEHLYQYSDALAELSPYFDQIWDFWSSVGRHPEGGEVEDGWFLWCFREAAAMAGYHNTLQSSQNFYTQVYEELNTAIQNGELQQGIKMPSALMPPLHDGYIESLFPTMLEALGFVFSYTNCDIDLIDSQLSSEELNNRFEEMTNNLLVHTELCTDQEMNCYAHTVSLLNHISYAYKFLGSIFTILGHIAFFYMIICFIINKELRTEEQAAKLLVLIAIYLSLFVLIAGISYNEIASCQTITVGYLSAAYPLSISFLSLSIVFALQNFKNLYKNGDE